MSRISKGALAAAGVVAALLSTARPAAAEPITVHYEGVGPGAGNAGQVNWNTGGTVHDGILYTPRGNGSSSDTHFVSFCIERTQGLPAGTHTYDLSTLGDDGGRSMGADAATALRSMWAEYRGGLDTNDESAAFQHAIWHLLDATYNPGLSGNQLDLYNLYLDSGTWNSGRALLAVLVSGNLQDQVLERGPRLPPPPTPGEVGETPAPPTLVVALLIAPALLLRRRRADAA